MVLDPSIISQVPSPGSRFRVRQRLGRGGYGSVCSAMDACTGKTYALKRVRVSQRTQRPVLRYEATMLQLLAGHPAIPVVFAYGHLPHFEYLALELFKTDLFSHSSNNGPLSLHFVCDVAIQMLSALEYLHEERGIVHLDIKPANMAMDAAGQIHLIDFGLAQSFRESPLKPLPGPDEERMLRYGTSTYASLNAHSSISLGPRDDLESLSFTLIFLLRKELPWDGYFHCDSQPEHLMKHIVAKKRAWPGKRLVEHAPAMPHEFGDLLDYARWMSGTRSRIDYQHYFHKFNDLRYKSEDKTFKFRVGGGYKSPRAAYGNPNEPPVRVGDVIYFELEPRCTIEGYGLQARNQSMIFNPAEYPTGVYCPVRPGAVVATEFDPTMKLHKLTVVPIIKRAKGSPAPSTSLVSIRWPDSDQNFDLCAYGLLLEMYAIPRPGEKILPPTVHISPDILVDIVRNSPLSIEPHEEHMVRTIRASSYFARVQTVQHTERTFSDGIPEWDHKLVCWDVRDGHDFSMLWRIGSPLRRGMGPPLDLPSLKRKFDAIEDSYPQPGGGMVHHERCGTLTLDATLENLLEEAPALNEIKEVIGEWL